jgi:hypothetical protein
MRGGCPRLWWCGVIFLLLALISFSPAGLVRAVSIVVDTAGDGDVPANVLHCPAVPAHTCTLRDAVAKAGSGDTINFASGLGAITVSHTGGTIAIGHDLTIAGQGTTTTIIDADADTQPFAITGPNTSSTGIPITINATFQDLTIQNINITTNSITGGAILVQSIGTLALTNVNFLNNSNANSGVFGGGAVFLNSFLRPSPPDPSYQLLSAPLVITNCTFTGNQTDFGGGAIEWNGPITIMNSTFTNNTANGAGTGADGGAILDSIAGPDRPTAPTGVVTVSNTTFTTNSSMDGSGGAISANAIVATDVTFSGNQTMNGFGGGAVELHLYPSTGSLPISKIVNATFDGNIAGSAGSSGQGGAITLSNGSLTLLNTTVTNNSAGISGGGVSLASGSLTLGDTVVAGNTGGLFGPDADAPITSLGHNLVGMIDGSSGWIVSDKTGGTGGNTSSPGPLDPRLLPLGNNGGTTQTRLPLPGSQALDAGDDTICNQTGPGTVNKLDQRGVTRPIGSHCDIGATEGTGGLIVPVAGTTPEQAAVGTAFAPAFASTVEDPGGVHLGSGISVTFTVAPVGGAGGFFSGNAMTAAALTDVNGIATAPTFTANTVGGGYTVTANLTAGPLTTPATFALTNTAGAPSSITPNTGTTPQSAPTGSIFALPLAATVADSGGNHVGSGLSVTFTVKPVGGAGATFPSNATTAMANTDVNGVATAPTLTANATPGSYTVTANLTSGQLAASATFSLMNTAAVPSSISANANTTPQSTGVNTAFGVPLSATVQDGSAHPMSGVIVTFTAPVSGASGTFPGNLTTVTATTDVNGVATAPTFTANATAGGPYAVNATASGVGTPAIFMLTNTTAALTGIALAAPEAIASSIPVRLGQTVQLMATGTFSDGSTHPLSGITWVSSNPQIVSVDNTGKFTVLGQGGPFTITGTLNGVSGQIVLTIGAPTLTGVGAAPAPAGRPGSATSGSGSGPVVNPIPASR